MTNERTTGRTGAVSDLVGFRLSLVTARIAFVFDDGREHAIEIPADLVFDDEGNAKLFDEDCREEEKAMVELYGWALEHDHETARLLVEHELIHAEGDDRPPPRLN